MGETLVHIDDLANLWGISDRHVLRVTLKRYVDRGLLFRLWRGFYSLRPPQDLDVLLVGQKAVHGVAYVSTETVLARAGLILQAVPIITLVGERTKRFHIGAQEYYVRQLASHFLYNPAGVRTEQSGARVASPERAVADILYFNPHAHFDAAAHIDWQMVRTFQETVGYPLTPNRYV